MQGWRPGGGQQDPRWGKYIGLQCLNVPSERKELGFPTKEAAAQDLEACLKPLFRLDPAGPGSLPF